MSQQSNFDSAAARPSLNDLSPENLAAFRTWLTNQEDTGLEKDEIQLFEENQDRLIRDWNDRPMARGKAVAAGNDIWIEGLLTEILEWGHEWRSEIEELG